MKCLEEIKTMIDKKQIEGLSVKTSDSAIFISYKKAKMKLRGSDIRDGLKAGLTSERIANNLIKQAKILSSKKNLLKNVTLTIDNPIKFDLKKMKAVVKPFFNLIILYHISAADGGSFVGEDSVKELDISDDELFKAAIKNTEKRYPSALTSIPEILGISETTSKKESVLTNITGEYGVSALLYKDLLYNVSQNFDSDLIIIPVSTDEVFLVKDPHDEDLYHAIKAELLKQNFILKNLAFENFLSDTFYLYEKDTRRITADEIGEETYLDDWIV